MSQELFILFYIMLDARTALENTSVVRIRQLIWCVSLMILT